MSDFDDGYQDGLASGRRSPTFLQDLFSSASPSYVRGLEAGLEREVVDRRHTHQFGLTCRADEDLRMAACDGGFDRGGSGVVKDQEVQPDVGVEY